MLKPALMFGDKAVLQRDKPAAVWGEADPGSTVTVRVQGQEACTVTDGDGKWIVYLEPLHTSFAEEMTISSGEDTLCYTGIMVGDVWFAAGQSNMEFHMRYDADFEEEKKVCENAFLRFFDYPEVSFPGQTDMADYGKEYGFWRCCDAENLERFSAVAYYCVKELQERLSVPMGILACNYGGSSAMNWIPEEVAERAGDRHRIEAYHRSLESMDTETYKKTYLANPGNFRTDQLADPLSDLMMYGCSFEEFLNFMAGSFGNGDNGFDISDLAGYAPQIGPLHEWRPAGLYESMLLPCVPYTIKGILWYQGCSDSETKEDAEAYYTVFPALIRHWRDLWKEELPFLFVQLAPLSCWWQAEGTYYPITRAAQQHTADTVSKAYMAVTGDVGMKHDIHPKKKKPVGHRLALLARHYVYGEDELLCEAPTLSGLSIEAGKITLFFRNAGDGLYLREPVLDTEAGSGPDWLRIYQDDELIDLTEAVITADGSTVRIESSLIKADSHIRAAIGETPWYCVDLYNSAGIPARPATVSGDSRGQVP